MKNTAVGQYLLNIMCSWNEWLCLKWLIIYKQLYCEHGSKPLGSPLWMTNLNIWATDGRRKICPLSSSWIPDFNRGHTSHLCYRQLTSQNTVLLCTIKQGSLDVYSNAAAVEHYLLMLFNLQRHYKSDMKHPWECSSDRKALWKWISKAKAWQKLWEIQLCFPIHMFSFFLNIRRSSWISHIKTHIF